MKIDENLLQRLEKLSYLQIPEDQRGEMIAQLSEIVSFVDNLSELSTEGVNPTFTMNDSSTYLREDKGNVNHSINDDILSNAPNSKDHFFIVPKIIE
ncbi:MAG TPA: Asp-tRNA(Asn)/Glu-tRNA(Gln) amidotransferase subunit GatC [Sulfuricurvum sp.]|nr:MAG: aspartyl/glutamyl-tRNA(Asn/Gln) amidotransferase subunit C [Campylobacterales bacterium 16-40-21]OZA03667.1 MAG: aspartyl/glutamyl-tRNA(Asn/Gln) amidotransferase subunit C [Sulfuricurvum sp. 17-40-25]HQS65817.1 Asp-tRNA(Asn)/Glu-tRNA(Gln) amidotransferase subunit GatC [Sulfuricurvum sp.]HQT37720.1 Asp-tRNA(Asn)/Glu-tRNA(Gln) amidotransferase subunit GatC [Sulfuricurvum sp.]